MVKEVQSAEDFSLDRIHITSERFREFIDIKKVTIEVNIFENIRMPYLTGSILILDDNGLFTAADFQGTERLEIDVSLPIDGAQTMSKTFIILLIFLFDPQILSPICKLSALFKFLFTSNTR